MKKVIKNKPRKLQISQKKSLYDKDFHAWSHEQASLIKRKEFARLDIENLVEEIESLSASDKRAMESNLSICLAHMLKIKYQPEKHTRSWDLSIKKCKFHCNKILKKNPSFKRLIPEFLEDAYFTARLEAAYETGLDEKKFPKKCPWSLKEVLGE